MKKLLRLFEIILVSEVVFFLHSTNAQTVFLSSPSNKEKCVSLTPTLQWSTYSGADHYHVRVSKNSDGSNPIFTHNNLHATSIELSSELSIGRGETIYWQIEAYDDGFWGESRKGTSAIWSFTTLAPSVTAPTLISPASGLNMVPRHPVFGWNSVSGATKYSISFSKTMESRPWPFSDRLVDPITIDNVQSPYTLKNYIFEENTVYYWQIGAFNTCLNKTSSSIRKFTTNLVPKITSITEHPENPEVNQEVQIKVTIIDDGNLEKVTLYFRQGGEEGFIPQLMTKLVNNEYGCTLQGSELNSRGLEYYVVALDKANDFSQTSRRDLKVIIPEPGVGIDWMTSSGQDQNRYRIVSFPLQLENNIAGAILPDDLGAYDNKKWRLYDYDSTAQKIEYNDYLKIQSGRGYWIIVKDGGKTLDTGLGMTYAISRIYPITLRKGHNLIGNPYNFSIPISNITFENTERQPELLTYSGGWEALKDSLGPFEGCCVFDTTGTNLIIDPRSTRTLTKLKANTWDWSLQIIARSGQAWDSYNFVGTCNQASKDLDVSDYPEPPVIGTYVSLYFPHPNWGKIIPDYCRDIRPTITELEEWPIEVKTNTNDKVDLKFEGVASLPLTLQAMLIDENAGITINLRNQTSYSFRPCNGDKPSLRLIIGTIESMQEKMDEWNMLPKDYSLLQNYPNPFNPSTTIVFDLPKNEFVTLTIMNTLSQQVAVLARDEFYSAGRHALVWDARNTQGERVGSGEYFYKIRTGNFTKINKMILLQ